MDDEGLLAKKLGSQAFYHDDMSIVVHNANVIAEQKPDDIVFLVLRASPGTSNMEFIPGIISSELRENILTLWTREE